MDLSGDRGDGAFVQKLCFAFSSKDLGALSFSFAVVDYKYIQSLSQLLI